MTDLYVIQGKPADAVTLADYLNEKQLIEDVGGYGYLVELWDAAPSAANAMGTTGSIGKRVLYSCGRIP